MHWNRSGTIRCSLVDEIANIDCEGRVTVEGIERVVDALNVQGVVLQRSFHFLKRIQASCCLHGRKEMQQHHSCKERMHSRSSQMAVVDLNHCGVSHIPPQLSFSRGVLGSLLYHARGMLLREAPGNSPVHAALRNTVVYCISQSRIHIAQLFQALIFFENVD